jgi:hypothetical protein
VETSLLRLTLPLRNPVNDKRAGHVIAAFVNDPFQFFPIGIATCEASFLLHFLAVDVQRAINPVFRLRQPYTAADSILGFLIEYRIRDTSRRACVVCNAKSIAVVTRAGGPPMALKLSSERRWRFFSSVLRIFLRVAGLSTSMIHRPHTRINF